MGMEDGDGDVEKERIERTGARRRRRMFCRWTERNGGHLDRWHTRRFSC